MARKSGPKLTDEQREQLLTWLAAGYGYATIHPWFAERTWPDLGRPALSYYREKYQVQIAALQAARHDSALNSGLALKEERVARLQEHADDLHTRMWDTDEKGRPIYEKAWRETLDQIAEELGQRVRNLDIKSGGKPIATFAALVQAAQEPPT